jgi:hypothetical protein
MNASLARLACLCLVVGFSTAAFAVGDTVSLVVGQDRMGGDYKGFPLAQPDAQQCRQACADDTACRAFTYVKPGIKGPEAMCFLKSSVVQATADACCTSGAKAIRPMANAARATPPPSVIKTIPMLVGKSAQQTEKIVCPQNVTATIAPKDAGYAYFFSLEAADLNAGWSVQAPMKTSKPASGNMGPYTLGFSRPYLAVPGQLQCLYWTPGSSEMTVMRQKPAGKKCVWALEGMTTPSTAQDFKTFVCY